MLERGISSYDRLISEMDLLSPFLVASHSLHIMESRKKAGLRGFHYYWTCLYLTRSKNLNK